MKCPKCKDINTSVLQSIKETGDSRVLRTRRCNVCGYRFQTSEKPQQVIVPTSVEETPVEETPAKTNKKSSRKSSNENPTESDEG